MGAEKRDKSTEIDRPIEEQGWYRTGKEEKEGTERRRHLMVLLNKKGQKKDSQTLPAGYGMVFTCFI